MTRAVTCAVWPALGSAGEVETATLMRCLSRTVVDASRFCTFALTVVVTLVRRVVRASPRSLETAWVALRDPAVVEKATGAPATSAPFEEETVAMISTSPPVDGTSSGELTRLTDPGGADPMRSDSSAVTAPELAVTFAWPAAGPERYTTVACPLLRRSLR